MFELKKILGGLIMPLPLFLIFMCLCLIIFHKNGKRVYIFTWLSVLALWAISTPFFAHYIITPTERIQHTFNVKQHPQLDYIVVLGCDIHPNNRLAINTQLGGCALSRLVEGIKLAHHYPRAKLIVSGAGFSGATNASLMAKTAQQLGIPKARIRQNPNAKDTAEEATYLAPILVDRKTALVTSASHMQRASDLFYAQGIDTIPAPVQFYSYFNAANHKQFIPSAGVLKAVTSYWHEMVGKSWIALRRWLDPEAL